MGFLFIEPNDADETAHIFPAYLGTDGNYYTFNDELFGNIAELENVFNNRNKLKDVNLNSNDAICHGIGTTVNDMGSRITKHYCNNQAETRTYAANRQNAGRNICGNCVKRLYKD